MNKKTIITILFTLVAMTGQAQTKVKGHVVNERGETVEYVSIGIEEDSVGVISDRDTERQGSRTGRGRGRSERQAAHTVGQVVDKDKHGRFSW